MSKFMSILTGYLLCWNAAFGGDITAGFSRDDAKNVVTDSIYKLMWQDGKDIFEGAYDEAVKYCENLNFAGYSDWRLPSIDELISITDKTKFSPAINSAFKNIASGEFLCYQSSTKYINDSSNAWVVDFVGGNDGWDSVFARSFVRCVRRY